MDENFNGLTQLQNNKNSKIMKKNIIDDIRPSAYAASAKDS